MTSPTRATLEPPSTNETHFCFIQQKKISHVQIHRHTWTTVHPLCTLSPPSYLFHHYGYLCENTIFALQRFISSGCLFCDCNNNTLVHESWLADREKRLPLCGHLSFAVALCQELPLHSFSQTFLGNPSLPFLSWSGLLHPKPRAPAGLGPHTSVFAHLWALFKTSHGPVPFPLLSCLDLLRCL